MEEARKAYLTNTENDTIEFDIYNQTRKQQWISLFNPGNVPHAAAVKLNDGKLEDATYKIRVMGDAVTGNMLFNPIKISKGTHQQKMPLGLFLNPYQHQSNIIEFNETLRHGDDVEFMLNHNTSTSVVLYRQQLELNKIKPIESQFENYKIERINESVCVIITNNDHRKYIEVDLFDFMTGRPMDVKVEYPCNTIEEIQQKKARRTEYKMCRAICFNRMQFGEGIKISTPEEKECMLNCSMFLSAMQIQGCVLDMPQPFMLETDRKYKVNVLPNTKIMFCFIK